VSRPLVYLDQNIISLQASGECRLDRIEDIQWAYSTEHFVEIQRSDSAEKYLSVLSAIGAKLLDIQSEKGKILDKATLHSDGDPYLHYQRFLETRDEHPIDDSIFDPFLAWINGGGDEGIFRALPQRIAEQVTDLLKGIPSASTDLPSNSIVEMRDVFDEVADRGNDIASMRKAFGLGKGGAGGISGSDPIRDIWNVIGSVCGAVTCDEFFGFAPRDLQGYKIWPKYLGIVGCCAVLDLLGFQAEKKCRKIEGIPNVRSDSAHIAMGAFCSAILSADRRLTRRASAIYKYTDCGTAVLLLTLTRQGS
jgi:hypothetical protein